MIAIADHANIRMTTGGVLIAMRQRIVTAGLVLFCVMAISACMPMVTRYNQLDGPGVEHRSSLCPTYGPPGRAVIREGEFEVTVSVNPGARPDRGGMVMSGPLDARLGLVTESLRIVEAGTGKARSLALSRLAPRPLPPGAKGAPRTRQTLFYDFPIPPDLADEGTLELPAFRFNGNVFPARELRFSRKTWVGTMPLNC